MSCRHCNGNNKANFIDLGSAPPSNAYLDFTSLSKPEICYPLKVFVCTDCWLVQTEDYAHYNDLFDESYAYFSSCSSSWLEHAKTYVENVGQRFELNTNSVVVEVAANDGYLLQFVKGKGINCYGIEPTKSTAFAAREKGILIIEEFFGSILGASLANEGKQADLMVANNVLAHVPDIVDFVKGFKNLLKQDGVATFEFPHLYNLVNMNQFDTIYHEHFSYLSLLSVTSIFESAGLQVFDVEKLSTHGGSLRIFAQRTDSGKYQIGATVAEIMEMETRAGINTTEYYEGFQQRSEIAKNNLLAFLLEAKRKGMKVVGYGAAAKGNTFLNYAGIRCDLVEFIADGNPAKQNKFMPGSRIPILSPSAIEVHKPDYIVIFPWNLINEIKLQLKFVKDWGAKFVTAIPELKVSS